MEVKYEGESRLMDGYCDYTIWYDPHNKDKLSTNLLVVEAKNPGGMDSCMGQVTAYMAMVHRKRKDEGKTNSVVYGVATDGLSYRFLRIDNDSVWSKSRIMEWDNREQAEIYTMFRKLIRVAALSSPSSSPIKSPDQKQGVVASFGSPERAMKVDFDFSSIEILEEDEETEIIG